MWICGLAVTQLRAGAAWVFYWTTKYVLRSAGFWRNSSTSTNGAGSGQDQVKSGRLNALRHRDYGPAATRGILDRPNWDGPLSQVIRHSTRRAPQPFRGAGLSSESVSWRTRRRTDACGACGVTGRDSNCRRKHDNVPSVDMGPWAGPTIGIV